MHPFLDLSPSLGDATLSLNPTAYWPMDDGSGPLRSLAQNWPAAPSGTSASFPVYQSALPSPAFTGVGLNWTPSSGARFETSTSFPSSSVGLSLSVVYQPIYNAGQNRPLFGRVGADGGWLLYLVAPTYDARLITRSSGGANVDIVSPSAGYTDGRLEHLFMSIPGAGGTATFVRNGVVTTASISAWDPTVTGTTLMIGNDQGLSGFFAGVMAHVAIWDGSVLSAATGRWLSSIVLGG